MVKPILVVGAGGQLARALRARLSDAVFLDRAEADLADPARLAEALERHDPAAVINAAGYTQVDNAEVEEDLAHRINAESPAAMAIFCAARRIPLVHFSTDYVFDGSGERPWRESDAPAPLNAYGKSKLAGEDAVAQVGGMHLLFRTSWMFDARGRNFVNAILRLAAEREELGVIDDQFGAPTYAPHLAAAVLNALDMARSQSVFPSGIYHLCAAGVTTWFGFASAIVARAREIGLPLRARAIRPIPASEYPLPATRPRNSRLDCTKALSMFGVALPPWQRGLAECMELKA